MICRIFHFCRGAWNSHVDLISDVQTDKYAQYNSDDSVYVATYYYDMTKNPHKAALRSPTEDAYRLVPPHDTNEYCVSLSSWVQDRHLADSTMDVYEQMHVFVYDPKIFKQYTWQEIKEKNMFLKHIQCSLPKYLDPPTVFEYP